MTTAPNSETSSPATGKQGQPISLKAKVADLQTLLWVIILGIFSLVLLVVYFVLFRPEDPWGFILREIGKAVLITTVLTGAAKLILTRSNDVYREEEYQYLRDRVNTTLQDVKGQVRDSTKAASDSIGERVGDLQNRVNTTLKDVQSDVRKSTLAVGDRIEERVDDLQKRVNTTLQEVQSQVRYSTEGVGDKIEVIVRELAINIEKSTNQTLDAMHSAGISRMYASRAHARQDIRNDLSDPEVSLIRLIGISLNDFVRGDEQELSAALLLLEEYIEGKRPLPPENRSGRLSIKVLIIDPKCLGAQLRSRAENRKPPHNAARLRDDVYNTLRKLRPLEKLALRKHPDGAVTFECRLYRLPPIMFLCLTDKVCYVESYHFWASRLNSVPAPCYKFELTEDPEETGGNAATSLHTQMSDHFDWIWDNASIPASEFLEEKSIGMDKGLMQTGTTNVFSDQRESLERMLSLLENAQERVYIQGVSLRSFFDHGKLFQGLLKLARTGKVNIKILVLNPECEQAKYRSYREVRLTTPTLTYSDYLAKPNLHLQSRLVRDTVDSIQIYSQAFTSPAKSTCELKTYDSSPSFFMLMVDDTVLVEQYHYGKVVPAGEEFPAILGKDMPVVEYHRKIWDLYDDQQDDRSAGDRGHVQVGQDQLRQPRSEVDAATPPDDPRAENRAGDREPDGPQADLRNPYLLLKDHFEFVFDHCAQCPQASLAAYVSR